MSSAGLRAYEGAENHSRPEGKSDRSRALRRRRSRRGSIEKARHPLGVEQGSEGRARPHNARHDAALKGPRPVSITNKPKRGTFPATLFVAVLAALELEGLALE